IQRAFEIHNKILLKDFNNKQIGGEFAARAILFSGEKSMQKRLRLASGTLRALHSAPAVIAGCF
ncbi:MAG: hypothetical protein IKU12_05870, partial [Oscillospiraceae bacterium]|nr:hypothetical protein [Oscillospiraceae bacterium]